MRPTANLAQMLEQTKKPLLNAVRLSGDFLPAYAPLLSMAQQLYTVNPGASRRLLSELEAASPTRPEARALRKRLFGK